MNLNIRECTMDDLTVLTKISYNTYDNAFRHMNHHSVMDAYLEKAFNVDMLREELQNNSSKFYFLYSGEQLAGYMKINEWEAQTDIHDPQSLELQRIYVLNEFHGKGFGRNLLNKAIEICCKMNKSYIWLGVWEKNEKAIRFYEKNGFYCVGKHTFLMGNEEQADFIMRKDL